MAPLSEKAKGKQRLIEPDLPTSSGPPSSSSSSALLGTPFKGISTDHPTPTPGRDIVIRFTEGYPDLQIRLEERYSVRDVKRMIRESRTEVADHRLRLIFSGRLLTDGIFLYEWLESLEKKQRFATQAATRKPRRHVRTPSGRGGHVRMPSGARTPTGARSPARTPVASEDEDSDEDSYPASKQPQTTWLHCSVGPKMEEGDEEMDKGNSKKGQIAPLRGFDRLTGLGFSPDDIRSVRAQFHRSSAANYLDGELDFTTDEEYIEHARALEDQWIESLDSTNPSSGSTSLSPSSDDGSAQFTHGILLGFFFPILPFFFMLRPNPPVFWEDGAMGERAKSVVFTRRTQMGLVVGFVLNLLFGWWRLMLDGS